MNYSEKLKHPKWQKKRLEILNRDNFKCKLCSDTETELHVHHLKYSGNPYDAPIEDLETLCKTCHSLKTFHPETIHGKYLKALKEFPVITVLLEDKAIALFYYGDNDKIEHCLSFKKKSLVFKNMVNFINDEWYKII